MLYACTSAVRAHAQRLEPARLVHRKPLYRLAMASICDRCFGCRYSKSKILLVRFKVAICC